MGSLELKISRTYIETQQKIRLIKSFKSPICISIYIDKKLDDNLYFCIDY